MGRGGRGWRALSIFKTTAARPWVLLGGCTAMPIELWVLRWLKSPPGLVQGNPERPSKAGFYGPHKRRQRAPALLGGFDVFLVEQPVYPAIIGQQAHCAGEALARVRRRPNCKTPTNHIGACRSVSVGCGAGQHGPTRARVGQRRQRPETRALTESVRRREEIALRIFAPPAPAICYRHAHPLADVVEGRPLGA